MPRVARISDEDLIAEVAHLRDQGIGEAEIAATLGVSKGRVREAINARANAAGRAAKRGNAPSGTKAPATKARSSAKRAGVACHSQEPLTLEQMHAVTSGEIVETQALLASARQLGDVKLIGQLQRILAQQTNAALRIAAKARPDPDVIVLSRAEIEEARKTVVETLVRYVETAIREVNHPE